MGATRMVSVRVWGEYACFTRPEFKVERVSYPIMTPSAARGLLEAIFWKPEFRYEIRRIGIVKPGTTMVILRNELGSRQGTKPYYVEDRRQQRTTMLLKDVEYLIEADVRLRPHASDPVTKYVEQFNRRVERGQYHHTPYLGTREFAAHFGPVDKAAPAPFDLVVGPMLFDIAFIEDPTRPELAFKRPGRPEPVKGYAQALFFDAQVKAGWLDVPHEKYLELYRLEEGHV